MLSVAEFLEQLVANLAAAGSIEAISSSFDDTSQEICQCLAVINETLLQIIYRTAVWTVGAVKE